MVTEKAAIGGFRGGEGGRAYRYAGNGAEPVRSGIQMIPRVLRSAIRDGSKLSRLR